jgi:hypothetical protein
MHKLLSLAVTTHPFNLVFGFLNDKTAVYEGISKGIFSFVVLGKKESIATCCNDLGIQGAFCN